MSTDIEPVDTALEPVNRRQASHHAPDEPRARFLALRAEGHSVASASELVDISESTGWNWWKRYRKLTPNQETVEILSDWVRLTRRAQGVLHDGLDEAEDSNEKGKYLTRMTVLAGVGTDKLQKDSTPTVTAQNVLIVVNAQKPDEPIDVEARVVDEA